MPTPVEPVNAVFDYAADIDGDGVVGTHEWVDGEPIGDTDIAEWLGTALARLHQLAPNPGAEPDWRRCRLLPGARRPTANWPASRCRRACGTSSTR
ncbi:hypothetical protein [Streptomyces sp. NPDC014006]|uniref:hypothetical protein n=1 Tax=Streptomyces sp. NPDC014006 TaxID=3364870 RepID=UPI0037023133